MCAVGRHRSENEDAEAALHPVDKPTLRSRIWANPVPMAAAGLVAAVVIVFGGWLLMGRDSGSSMVYPWTTSAAAPVDVSVTVAPVTEGPPSPSPVATSKSPKPKPSSSSSSSPRPTVLAAGAPTVTYQVQKSWKGAFQGEFLVTNGSAQTVDSWLLRASFPDGLDIYGLWEARSCTQRVTNELTAISVRPLAAGQSIKVGFLATYSHGTPAPSPLTVKNQPTGCPTT